MGTTARGTTVEVFREVVKRTPHLHEQCGVPLLAGYSGGAKAVVPGTASARTVTENHSHMVKDTAVAALLDGNPVREDSEKRLLWSVSISFSTSLLTSISGL